MEKTTQELFDENLILFTDEDGNDCALHLIDVFEYQGKEYIALLEPDDDQVLLLEVVMSEDGDKEIYIGIEDDEVLNAVFLEFKKHNEDIFDFVDDDDDDDED